MSHPLWYTLLMIMTDEQKTELKQLFVAHPNASVLEWMVVTPALDNNDVWDCYEEWQEEED